MTAQETLQNKYAESQRRLNLADATERALKNQLRSTEAAAKSLKEELGRVRILVAQTRAQCANEVRKRERTIEGLKKHVGEGGRPRGSGKAVGVATITVVAGVGSEEGPGAMARMTTSEQGYDLRMETNEFLTQLASGLSEENENLGGLVRRTTGALKELSGWAKTEQDDWGIVMHTEMGYENMATELDSIIEHLRTLLTNPSFVPLEEVEIREEEIIRLREGWEKMESRWVEAVQMMDGWRKRMATSGQTVNLEELKLGLSLSPVKIKEKSALAVNMLEGLDEQEEEGDTQADIDAMNELEQDADDADDAESTREIEETDEEEELDEDGISSTLEEAIYNEPFVSQRQGNEDGAQTQQEEASFNTVSSAAPSPPQPSPLRESNRNTNYSPKRLEAFTTILEENTWDLAQLDNSNISTSSRISDAENISPIKRRQPSKSPAKKLALADTTDTSVNDSSLLQSSKRKAPTPRGIEPNGASKLPRPREKEIMQSPLTMASIAAKLAATEREADAARVRAKLVAARKRSAPAPAPTVVTTKVPTKSGEDDREVMQDRNTGRRDDGAEGTRKEAGAGEGKEEARRKRKAGDRQGGRASRRRSTLSPWELESLILGNVATPGRTPKRIGHDD